MKKHAQSLVLPLLFLLVVAVCYWWHTWTYVTPAPAGYDEMVRKDRHGPTLLEVLQKIDPDHLNESVDLDSEE